MRRLVLLDIDGTLLTTDGAAARAFRAALHQVFGACGRPEGYSFAGKTDSQIARDLLLAAGVAEEQIDRRLDQAWEIYAATLAEEVDRIRARAFPGARELVDRLHASPDALLGLLTGNVPEGARLKLESAGLRFDRFQVGAFGSDHAERRELPALAIARAEAASGRRFTGKDVVIIGDTPLDIACGEHLGVRTIAVSTGNYSSEELAACGPDHLFESLQDTDAVCRAIFQ